MKKSVGNRQKHKNQKRAKIKRILKAASNIVRIQDTLVAAEEEADRTVVAEVEAGHIVAEADIAASAEVVAGHTVAAGEEVDHTAVEADIAASAEAEAEAGCTAAGVAAEEEVGCMDPGVSVVPDWTIHFGSFRLHVLRCVVEPRELVEFLREQVSAVRDWATKS